MGISSPFSSVSFNETQANQQLCFGQPLLSTQGKQTPKHLVKIIQSKHTGLNPPLLSYNHSYIREALGPIFIQNVMIWDIYLLDIFDNLSPAAFNNAVTLVCFRGSSLPQLCLCRILLLGSSCWGNLQRARNWWG